MTDKPEKWPDMQVKYLVMESDHFIVCIDPEMDVDWQTADSYEGHKDEAAFHNILNDIALLESQPNHELKPQIRLSYKRMLGEAVARALHHDYVNAGKILGKAKLFLEARQGELARSWYLTTGGIVTISLCLIGQVLWHGRAFVTAHTGHLAFWVSMSSIAGATGAFFSIIMRMGKVSVALAAGKTLHMLECGCRIMAGMISAVLIALAIYSDMIFPIFWKSNHPHAFLLLAAIAAGASERFAPSIIETLEKQETADLKREGKLDQEKSRSPKTTTAP